MSKTHLLEGQVSLSLLAIFKEIKDSGVKYRNRIRSRISNLKDLKNPELRINVLLGNITAERLAVLTAEVSVSTGACVIRVGNAMG